MKINVNATGIFNLKATFVPDGDGFTTGRRGPTPYTADLCVI